MFGFGKKKATKAEVKEEVTENVETELNDAKMPAGMKETAQRMMSGQFDLNDMLAQLKQIKKMSNFSGLLKMVPGMSGAVSAMKEKIKETVFESNLLNCKLSKIFQMKCFMVGLLLIGLLIIIVILNMKQ